VGDGKPREFTIDENDLVRFRGRLCVPQKSEVKLDILREAHKTPYTVHPGGNQNVPRFEAKLLVEADEG
jgi:hypothetical protein